jgi:hypothetical protein
MDKAFKINSTRSSLKGFTNIFGHVTISVDDWCQIDDEDTEYGHASISLDKKRLASLITELEHLYQGMIEEGKDITDEERKSYQDKLAEEIIKKGENR